MRYRNEYEKPTWFERLIILLIIVFVLGFLSGFAVHDRILAQNPGHAVWKTVFLLK